MKYALIALALAATASSPVLASEALAKSKNCLACHQVDKKVVGPAYKEVAKKRANEKDAIALLSEHILKGSKGVYGPVPMPPNANVKPEEAKALATWIMSLK